MALAPRTQLVANSVKSPTKLLSAGTHGPHVTGLLHVRLLKEGQQVVVKPSHAGDGNVGLHQDSVGDGQMPKVGEALKTNFTRLQK